MPKIHILNGGTDGVYTAIVHIATPVGNNSAGFLWSDVIKFSGRAKSRLTAGAGPGQTTQAELDQIAAGTLIEGIMLWQDTPSMNNTQRAADLDQQATQLTNDLLANWSSELKWFGITRT